MPESFDVIVIGGGPGGYVAAIRAAQLGQKTAVVERDKAGGRCLDYACIPAQTVLRTAEIFSEAKNGAELGAVGDVRVDWPALQARRGKVSESLSGGVKFLWDKNKITMIEGEGSLTAVSRYARRQVGELALGMADLIIPLGARFDDRVTGRVDEFAPGAKVAHFDIDPREIGKIRHADLPVLGNLRDAVVRTGDALRGPADSAAWIRLVRCWRERFPLRYEEGGSGLKGPEVLEHLAAAVAGHEDVIWTTGVGQHQMWAMQYLPCERPRSFLSSGGHRTMGFGLPAAIGARAARPAATVVCVDGDGSFPMTCQELGVAVAERLSVVVLVLNNSGLGMVRQWQEIFYEGRLSAVRQAPGTDIAAVARGFGARAFTVRSAGELNAAFAAALASDETCLLDVRVEAGEMLYPMIQPGSAAVDILKHPA
jgi:acetolactate synthase-1/2/3 large subunit